MINFKWLVIVGTILLLAGCSNATAPTATLEASATAAIPTQTKLVPTPTNTNTPEPSPTPVPLLDIPPGQYIVYSKRNYDAGGNGSYSYYAIDPKVGTPILIIDDVDIAAVSPDSLRLVFIRDGLIYNYNLENGYHNLATTQIPLPEGTSECESIAWSPDSKQYLLSCGNEFEQRRNLLVEDPNVLELPWENLACSFSWAPDSQRFVAYCYDPEWGLHELRIFDDPEKPGRVVLGCEGRILCASPAWSPTGEWIAFFRGIGLVGSPASPNDGIYVIRPDCIISASKCTRAITTPLVSGEDPSWSPSGDFVALRDNGSINIVNINDHSIRNLEVPDSVDSIAWVPDGESIVFSDWYNGLLYSIDVESGKSTILDKGDFYVSGSFTRSP